MFITQNAQLPRQTNWIRLALPYINHIIHNCHPFELHDMNWGNANTEHNHLEQQQGHYFIIRTNLTPTRRTELSPAANVCVCVCVRYFTLAHDSCCDVSK